MRDAARLTVFDDDLLRAAEELGIDLSEGALLGSPRMDSPRLILREMIVASVATAKRLELEARSSMEYAMRAHELMVAENARTLSLRELSYMIPPPELAWPVLEGDEDACA